MTDINLADSYKAEQISLGPDTMRLRQNAFNKLREGLNEAKCTFLVRLYYGLPNAPEHDWFRAGFADEDPSFSMMDNKREAAILAGALLNFSISNGNEFSAIVTLAAAAAGNRKPLVTPQLLQTAIDSLAAHSHTQRKHAPIDFGKIKTPASVKVNAEVIAAVAGFAALAPALQSIADQSIAATTQLAKQVTGALQEVSLQNNQLREEIDMLWWFVGGWSRLLNEPLANLDLGLAAVLASLDMSDLSRTISGPLAAPSLLLKILMTGRKGKSTKVTLQEVVDSVPEQKISLLQFSDRVLEMSDLCPVLSAIKKSQEIGATPAWHGAFQKLSHLKESISFSPLDLAIQVMRERTIIGEI